MIKRITNEALNKTLTAIRFDLLNAVENETDMRRVYRDELIHFKIAIRYSLVGLFK